MGRRAGAGGGWREAEDNGGAQNGEGREPHGGGLISRNELAPPRVEIAKMGNSTAQKRRNGPRRPGGASLGGRCNRDTIIDPGSLRPYIGCPLLGVPRLSFDSAAQWCNDNSGQARNPFARDAAYTSLTTPSPHSRTRAYSMDACLKLAPPASPLVNLLPPCFENPPHGWKPLWAGGRWPWPHPQLRTYGCWRFPRRGCHLY